MPLPHCSTPHRSTGLSHGATSALFVLASLGCAHTPVPDHGPAGAVAGRRLAVIALNDVYRVAASPENPEGGLARVATLARDLDRQGHDVIVTLAGDFVSPSLETTLGSAGRHMIDALNAIEGEPGGAIRVVATLGNHEFDLKTKDYCATMSAARFTIVAADTALLPDCPGLELKAWTTADVGGRHVCITGSLGTIAAEVREGATPTDLPALMKSTPAGCDTRLVLTHQNMPDDVALAGALQDSRGPFTAILGGHEHMGLADVARSPWVLKAPSDARRVFVLVWGALDEPIRLDVALLGETPTEAPDVVAIGQWWRADRLKAKGIDPALWDRPLWRPLPVVIEGEEAALRERETTLANLVADASVAARPGSVAIVNVGSLRLGRNIPGGATLTVGHLVETDLFNAQLVAVPDVTAAELTQVVTATFGEWPGSGRFPAVSSNLQVTWKPGSDAVVTRDGPGETVVLITSEYMCQKSGSENAPLRALCDARGARVQAVGTIRELVQGCLEDDACRSSVGLSIGRRRLFVDR
jgi:2',3'-cyclic-nucleotide 2'-phosphodiesterase (5'-nucleotidase family)